LFDVTVFKHLLYPIYIDMAAFNLTGQGMQRKGHESFDLAQDRELFERPVEWKLDFLRSHQYSLEKVGITKAFSGLKRSVFNELWMGTLIEVCIKSKG
jgi:hypothetical protein